METRIILEDETKQVVKEFKQSEDNSTRAISERLGMKLSRVDAIINRYLGSKKIGLKFD